MSTATPPTTVAAEEALRAIWNLADVGGDNDTATGSSIIGMCSVAEAYTDTLLDALVVSSSLNSFSLGRMLLADVGGAYKFTWEERLKWLTKEFAVQINGTAPVQAMLTLVELRNAITHGGGSLTWMQKKTLPKQLDLEHRLVRDLSVAVDGGRIYYDRHTVIRARTIISNYIRTVDRETLAVYPELQL